MKSSGSQPIDEKRPAQHAFSQKAPVPGPPTVAADPDAASAEQFHAPKSGRHSPQPHSADQFPPTCVTLDAPVKGEAAIGHLV